MRRPDTTSTSSHLSLFCDLWSRPSATLKIARLRSSCPAVVTILGKVCSGTRRSHSYQETRYRTHTTWTHKMSTSSKINALARDTYTGASTSIEIDCPQPITGLERIMLVAQGDLQRLLSAFFGRTINIECIYSETSSRGTGASPQNPIKQARQVHLKCGARVLCVATSSVTVTSPECERLLLDERFALGQIFRHLRRYPDFALLSVGAQTVDGKRELRRTYTLHTEGIMCEILEVFPDRDMFSSGEAWLAYDPARKP